MDQMSEDDPPWVSVVLPTLNERRHLTDCLDSLLHQDYERIREFVVVDGGSTDGTCEMAARFGDLVRVVDNPGVTAAAAMNVAIDVAACDLIVRADAHTVYAKDYVRRSVGALMASGADWVGGRMVPVGRTAFGRAVAAVTTSPFGVGPGRFHYSEEATDVETVYLGTFDRRIVEEVGGYDAHEIQWAAEDQELAFRLRKAGRRVRLDPTIRSWYFPRESPRELWRQYANYGMCKASTLKKHRQLPYLRPLAPAALVAIVTATSVGGATRRRWIIAGTPLLAYLAGAGAVAGRLSRDPGVAPHRAFMALSICHWAYGLGFWRGIGRILANRPFDSLPKGSR
jgi:glycosyltransferase involved in cell wall biosynthesis